MAAPFQIPNLPPDNRRERTVRRPNLGLQFNRDAYEMDPRSLVSCNNARIKNGEVQTVNMGWGPFPENIGAGLQYNLDFKQVLLIETFVTRAGATLTVFANKTDLFLHDAAGPTLKYLTPLWNGGAGGAGLLAGGNVGEVDNLHITATIAPNFTAAKGTSPINGAYGQNVRPGDFVHFGANGQNLQSATWFEIASVTDFANFILLVDPGVIPLATKMTIRQTFTGDNFDLWHSVTYPKAQTLLLPSVLGAAPLAGNRNEDTLYITNGIEMVQWDGNDAQADWFFPGFVCRRFQYHRQILMCGKITEAGEEKSQAVKTSQLNFPEEFSGGVATEFVSANGTTDLETMETLGDSVILYFSRDIEIATFVGPPLFWIIRSAVPGIGIIAPNALADFGDYHEILSHDRAYRFDGVGVQEVMSRVMREVLRKQAPNRAIRSHVHIDDQQGEAIWSIPLSTDGGGAAAVDAPPETAFTQHYLEAAGGDAPPPMMQRDFPFTATGDFIRATAALRFSDFVGRDDDDFSLVDFAWDDRALQASFPFSIAGDGNGDIWILSTKSTKGVKDAGVDGLFTDPVDSRVRFPNFALGDGTRLGLLHWLEPFADAAGVVSNLRVIVRMADRYGDLGEGLIGSGSADYDLSHQVAARTLANSFDETGPVTVTDHRVPFRLAGRYMSVEFQSEREDELPKKGAFFGSSGYRVAVSPMGDR